MDNTSKASWRLNSLFHQGIVRAVVGIAFCLLLGGVSNSRAISMLSIFDGSTTVVISDNDMTFDLDGTEGSILYVGPGGTVVMMGLTKPFMGSAGSPFLQMAGMVPVGTFTLLFTDTGFTGPGPVATALFGGTTAGTVTYTSWVDASNTPFGMATPLTSLGFSGTGAFSGMESVPFGSLSDPYSLTLGVTIDGSSIPSTFSATLSVPDRGETVVLLGSTLGCLAAFAGLTTLRTQKRV